MKSLRKAFVMQYVTYLIDGSPSQLVVQLLKAVVGKIA